MVLEGEAGFRRRVAAWEKHHQRPFPAGVLFLFGGFQVTSRDDVLALAAAIDTAGGAELVIVDTLNRAALGADENTSDGMGSILRGAQELQALTGGLVALVHHPGKDSAKGMRGHSSLFAALDAAIEVTRSDSRREWKVAKSKDGEDGKVHAFSLRVVDLGEDEDGEAVTSCVVEAEQLLDDEMHQPKVPKSGNQKRVFDALGPLLLASSDFGCAGAPPTRPCITVEQAVEGARQSLTCEPRRQPERVRLALTGLANMGAIHINEGWLWLA